LRLLERDTQRVRLTPAGELALREFRQLLRQFEESLTRISLERPATRQRLRIGMLWWADLSGFSQFEQQLVWTTGIPAIEPVVGQTVELIEKLRRGEIDATMLVLPCSAERLRLHPVARADHVALLPSAHPLSRKRALRLRDLEALPAFLRFRRRENPPLYDHFSALYEASGFRPPREEEAPGTVATLSQIAAGRGCTVMPRIAARRSHPESRHGGSSIRSMSTWCLQPRSIWSPNCSRPCTRPRRRWLPPSADGRGRPHAFAAPRLRPAPATGGGRVPG